MISILILTRDEEVNIFDCLSSVAWCDDVILLDSYSEDQTVPLAEAQGIRVYQRAFDDFASQRNYALDDIEFAHDWVFFLDADERFTEGLREACYEAVAQDRFSGYLIPGKTMFMGKWLRWAATYPVYQMRMLKRGELRFVQTGHGQREGEAKRGLGTLTAPYLHYSFSKGLEEWRARQKKYAVAEAGEAWKLLEGGSHRLRDVCTRDAIKRRCALRRLSFLLPCRAQVRFFYMYIIRWGFLDGRAGFEYCKLVMSYEMMITEALREKNRTRV